MTRQQAIKEIYLWQYDNTRSFYNSLVTLIHRADGHNKVKLGIFFPEILSAYYEWCDSEDYGRQIFINHGLMEIKE